MEARLPADNGAKGVWRQALIDSHIFLFIQAADVQVSAIEREARSGPRLDEGVVELPPAGVGKQPNGWLGEKWSIRGSFPIHKPGPPSHIPIIDVFGLYQNCNQSEMQSAKTLVVFCLPKSKTLCILSAFLYSFLSVYPSDSNT